MNAQGFPIMDPTEKLEAVAEGFRGFRVSEGLEGLDALVVSFFCLLYFYGAYVLGGGT